MITCKNLCGQVVTLPKEKFRFRPSVYGIIRKSDKICICRNKSNGKIWFPGGGIEVGESMKAALLREIDEETGLKNVTIGRLLGSFENFFYDQPADFAMHAFLFFYYCETDETALKSNDQIEDDDIQDLEWLQINRIKKDDLGDMNEEIYSLLQGLA